MIKDFKNAENANLRVIKFCWFWLEFFLIFWILASYRKVPGDESRSGGTKQQRWKKVNGIK
jgi:hypothetical protein